MNADHDDVTDILKTETELAHIHCNSSDRNRGNIIIEVSEVSSETDQINKSDNSSDGTLSHEIVDSPDLINIGDYKTDDCISESVDDSDTVGFCETLFESEGSNALTENTDGQFLTPVDALTSEANIIEDIPNEVLVYTCNPESSDPLDTFPCKSCGIVSGCIFCLKSHYESVHLNLGLIQYKCEQTSYLKFYNEICHKCNLVCESRQEMFEHRQIHFVTCDVCDMSFDSALFLSNHCKTTHDKFEVIISCDLCEQWFKQLQDLSVHYQDYHEMILCIVCFKRFSNTTELTNHHSSHKIILTDVRPILPYACSKCNQAFAEISELSSHLVRDHPSRKASYGSITRKRTTVKVKHRKKNRVQFDDCGGLSQGAIIVDLEEDCIGTNIKKLKRNLE